MNRSHSSDLQEFAASVREHYPEGLTGLFPIGATRRTYILETQRGNKEDLGTIKDFSDMGEFLLGRYLNFCEMFYSLGGQNAIVTILSFRSFFERGEAYAVNAAKESLRLINQQSIEFYEAQQVDPYFAGLEPMLHQPVDSPMYEMAQSHAVVYA